MGFFGWLFLFSKSHSFALPHLQKPPATHWWQAAFLPADKPSPRTDEWFGSLGLLNPEINQINCRKGMGDGREDA